MGIWWQEAHLRVSFQARPSLVRKAMLRWAAFWTSAGTESAAGRRAVKANRIAAAVRRRMTKLLLLGGFSRAERWLGEGFFSSQFSGPSVGSKHNSRTGI